MIHLGYRIPDGAPVEIPLKHMVVTGQTQEAGKTTALEALLSRSGLRAVSFITKRGEASFATARRIEPYFREQADWQFVASLLEASRAEKLKFERAWIIRASRGARTLAEVQQNVRRAMETAKGLSADVYLTLDAYLEVVVPQLARVRWASTLELRDGVNAVDLTGLALETQHLVIKSTLEWVLKHATNTVVVVPEAWQFIPQGRGTPVKLAAEAFVRQAATLGNFLWLDSQDIGGVDKVVLRSCPVWVLGVQREINEIKRTLENIPAGIAKPKAADIATLELGQFYACWGRHAIKTYVQPARVTADVAIGIARNLVDVRVARPVRDLEPPKEDAVEGQEADDLRQENARLRRENAELRTRIEAPERRTSSVATPVASPASPGRDASRAPDAPRHWTLEDTRDTEELYQAFKARLLRELPLAGAVVQVTPPEKLRADFQTAEVERLLDEVRSWGPLQRIALKFLEAVGTRQRAAEIAARVGRPRNGDFSNALKYLVSVGCVHTDSNGFKARTREKIAANLATYGASDADTEAVYQRVLYELATEDSAAA